MIFENMMKRKPKKEDNYEHPDFAGKLKKNKGFLIHHDIGLFLQLSVKELDYEFHDISHDMKLGTDAFSR